MIVRIFKGKGDMTSCGSYRGVSICSPLRKKHPVDIGYKFHLIKGAKAREYQRTLTLSSRDTP